MKPSDLGLMGCTNPHSWDCMAPFDPDCPLYKKLHQHMNASYWGMKAKESGGVLIAKWGNHDAWMMECPDSPCPENRGELEKLFGKERIPNVRSR